MARPAAAARRSGARRAAALPPLLLALALPLSALLLQAAPALAAAGSTPGDLAAVTRRYLTNDELAAWADGFVARCGSVAKKYVIGKSASGKHDLIVLEISDRPGVKEPEPSFQYVANMHGNEPSGRMLLPALAEHLCANADAAAAADKQAARLVKEAHVHMLLTMNPDGYAARRRENANYADLNRDFPDPVARKVALDGPVPGDGAIFSSPGLPGGKSDFASAAAAVRAPSGTEQPETLAVMRWMLNPPAVASAGAAAAAANGGGEKDAALSGAALAGQESRLGPFTAGANLHEGAVVANYPWDGYADGSEASRGAVRSAPEDAALVRMSKAYAGAHAFMSKSTEFKGGIVNGAQWYPVYGGLQDWGYVAAGTPGITLELSQEKMRPAADLPSLWRENRAALVALPVAAVLGGARGRVWAAPSPPKSGGKKVPLPGAGVAFDAVNRTTVADGAFAFFARPLGVGRHVARAWAPGYRMKEQAFVVPADGSGAWLDLVLEPLSASAASSSAAAAGGGKAAAAETEEAAATGAADTEGGGAASTTTTVIRSGSGRRPNSSEPAGGGDEASSAASWSPPREEERAEEEEEARAAESATGDAAAAERGGEGAADGTLAPPGARAVSAGALVVLAQAAMIVGVAGAVALQQQRRRSGAGGGGEGGAGGGAAANGGGGGKSMAMASVGSFRPSRQPPPWRPVPLKEEETV